MIVEHQELKTFLPQRYPFLLVDRVVQTNDDSLVAIKNVTGTDRCLEGHFPDEPLFPGVLLVEAMAQTGGLLLHFAASTQSSNRGYLAKIEQVKFKQFIRPGDQIVMKATNARHFGSMARVKVFATVDSVEVGEGDITYYFREAASLEASPRESEMVEYVSKT